jgi:uncharacterized membrane protein YkvA (DUF1232 family)
MLEAWKERTRQLKIETYAIYLAYRDPRVPWYARLFAACVVGYAFSPMDLVPDPIPILGYLDDLVLVPLGVALALKMIPEDVMAECREKADQAMREGTAVSWKAAAVIVLMWVLLALLGLALVLRALRR